MPTLGLIVEGEYDIEALSVLSGRINNTQLDIRPRLCRGSVQGRFGRILRELSFTAHPSRVVVVSDANGRNHGVLAADLEREVARQTFDFPVHFVVLVQELEALLLADPRAIETVCARRGTPISPLNNLTDSPENIPDPKDRLRRILRQANTSYTKVIAREIALEANLELLSNWCPSFQRLRSAVKFD